MTVLGICLLIIILISLFVWLFVSTIKGCVKLIAAIILFFLALALLKTIGLL